MQEAGVDPYDIPLDNYHIVPSALLRHLTERDMNVHAITVPPKFLILINMECTQGNLLSFGSTVFHETLHAKAYLSMEAQEKRVGGATSLLSSEHRSGVMARVRRRRSEHDYHPGYLVALHEAIVAETEKRFMKRLLEVPFFEKEKEEISLNSASAQRRELLASNKVVEDDVVWLNAQGTVEYAPYGPQRRVLNYVCAEIQKQFSERYLSTDAVFKLFLQANFNGNLLQIGRLVERTFGPGSFRLLGSMDMSDTSGILILDALRAARVRQELMQSRKKAKPSPNPKSP
jgi:hypothetical protein